MAAPSDCPGEFALMFGAIAVHPARHDFAAFGNEPSEQALFLKVDIIYMRLAKPADFPATVRESTSLGIVVHSRPHLQLFIFSFILLIPGRGIGG